MADLNQEGKAVEQTTASITVEATVDQCFAIGVDIAAYPEWVEGISVTEILTSDDEGRPLTARFEAEAAGRKTDYTLEYDLSNAPNQMSWSLLEGDLTRSIKGRYSYRPVDGAEHQTEVQYELAIDLAVPMPGFVKRRAEDKIVTSALKGFKRRVER